MSKLCACGCGERVLTEGSRWRPGHWKRGPGITTPERYELAESRSKVEPHELGTAGTSIFAGQYSTDINAEWNSIETRNNRLEEMEKTDSACRALFSVVTLPIRSVNWWVEPASDSSEDKDIADSITWNLIHGMTNGFDSLLQEILTCVSRGFSIFEKVFESSDADEFTGSIKWRKFAYRAQRTIDRWNLDNTGGLTSVHQDFMSTQYSVSTDIPIEKLLVFTYNREGSDYSGQPLFRACWRDYYYKDALQKIEAIGLERFWIGIPWIRLPQTSTKADKDKAFDIVKKIRGDEAAGLVTPDNWVFEIVRVATEGGSMADVISRYARNIFLTGLAQFLTLGEKSSGSWALSRDQSALFLFSLNAVADNVIADTFNRHAIPQLIKMNWPKIKQFPQLKHEDLEQIDLKGFFENLATAVTAGFLTSPDQEIEQEVRKMMGLPELTEEQQDAYEVKIQQAQEMQAAQVEAAKQVPGQKPGEKQKPEEKKPQTKKEESSKALAEIRPELLEPVLITDEDIAIAIIDFSNKAPEFAGILEASS